MSDIMRQIPFDRLMNWVLDEYSQEKSVFGVRKFASRPAGGQTLPLFREKLEYPCGPAAGPHTQLAQNIIAAYVAGGRFFELKTVQILDGEDLPVSKPCILARDECYNVEWSTELYVPQALDEYIKAWFALSLLSRELGLGDKDGFIFNMSVGYDLAGIKTEKIDRFIEGLKNAESTGSWRICKQWALDNLGRFTRVDQAFIESVSPRICDSITLSTLHGCPPDEIERIAVYLITEKQLNTLIKCNPTLLGYEYARRTLDSLGFDYIAFDDHHFKADLQFADAVPMFRRLIKLCEERGLEFGVKLTNTFPVQVTAGELPGEEMYMSGRALFPLAVALAERLSLEFGGKLRVSYSGGAEARNIAALFEAGIWPITVATTLLKPGGYQRLYQMTEKLAPLPYRPFQGIDLDKLRAIRADIPANPLYRKTQRPQTRRPIKERAPLADGSAARLAGEGRQPEVLPDPVTGAAVHRDTLECAPLCECCADVCPNRANVAVSAAGRRQIVHVDAMCNECGNCAVFCPYANEPYRDKFTLFSCEADFTDSENQGFLPLGDGTFRVRLEGRVSDVGGLTGLPGKIAALIQAVMACGRLRF